MYIVTWLYKSNHLDGWNDEPVTNVSMVTFDRRHDATVFVQALVDDNPSKIHNLQLFKKVFGAFEEQNNGVQEDRI